MDARRCHARPIHNPSVIPAKERAPNPNSATEWRGKAPVLGRGPRSPGQSAPTRAKMEVPIQQPTKNQTVPAVCTTVLRYIPGTPLVDGWVGGLMVGWVVGLLWLVGLVGVDGLVA